MVTRSLPSDPLTSGDPTVAALTHVVMARKAQDEMKARGRFEFTCADDELEPSERLAILAEEFGEVARSIIEHDRLGTRHELSQVAAVCVAWVEHLDRAIQSNLDQMNEQERKREAAVTTMPKDPTQLRASPKNCRERSRLAIEAECLGPAEGRARWWRFLKRRKARKTEQQWIRNAQAYLHPITSAADLDAEIDARLDAIAASDQT
jgi:NTP pyrophosphatase (non-canonical NTP hydrolase)